MLPVFVTFAMPGPWWRTMLLPMSRWDPVVSNWHLEDWGRNPLHHNGSPGTIVGWGREPLVAVKDIIFPSVKEIVIG
jgi:hypothetical protein